MIVQMVQLSEAKIARILEEILENVVLPRLVNNALSRCELYNLHSIMLP